MLTVSYYIVPTILFGVGMLMIFSPGDLFGKFTEGAKDGLKTAVSLLPTLVGLICAVSMFTASGASDALSSIMSPVLSALGVPGQVSGLVTVRPFSGGGSTAMLSQIFEDHGPDSFAGRCASIIAGSSDTIFYMLGVYFSSVRVKKTRFAVPCAIVTMLFCVVFGCFLAKILI